jgi:hypothetical protein
MSEQQRFREEFAAYLNNREGEESDREGFNHLLRSAPVRRLETNSVRQQMSDEWYRARWLSATFVA